MSVRSDEISPRLRTLRIGRRVEHRASVASTNDLARTLADGGAPHGTLVIADEQVAGRGRRGRSWSGLPGDQLFASFVLRPALPAERAFEVTIVAAVALADAMAALGARPAIKWPNDVELDGRKCAGILAELAAAPDGRLKHIVLGIGVNVGGSRGDMDAEFRDRATTWREAMGSAPTIAELAAAVCDALERWLDRLEAEGLAPVLDAWRRRSSTLGAEVRVVTEGRELHGLAADVDVDGALIVRDAAGTLHRIVAGDVVNLRRA